MDAELERKVDTIVLAGWRYGKQKEELLELIQQEIAKARIDEVNWLRKHWQDYMLKEDETLFDDHIAELSQTLKEHKEE